MNLDDEQAGPVPGDSIAGQEKPGQPAAGIEEMLKVLEEVRSEASKASFLAQNQESEKLKMATLARAGRKIHDIVGPWWNLMDPPTTVIDPAAGTGGGVFYTPKKAIDVVMANPPLGAGKIPLGAEPWRNVEPDSVGIRSSAKLVQAWVVSQGASVDVRATRVNVDMAEGFSTWQVVASVDCEEAFVGVIYGGRLRANAVCKALRNALLAARLRRKHWKMNRQARAEEMAIAVASEPPPQADDITDKDVPNG